MKLDLLTPGIEVGLVTTNLDAMIGFYEGFLELEFQGEIEFPGGSQRRYSLGGSVLKLVTYTTPPPLPATPGAVGGGRNPVLHDRRERPDRVGGRSPTPLTRWWSRSPSSSRYRGWAGCSSPIPMATGSNCSARCRHDHPAADTDLLPASRSRDVRAVQPMQPVHLPGVHARRRGRASVRGLRDKAPRRSGSRGHSSAACRRPPRWSPMC